MRSKVRGFDGIHFCNFLSDRVGFPIMLLSVFASMMYLFACHLLFEWHPTAG
jgi:hypothetical protein